MKSLIRFFVFISILVGLLFLYFAIDKDKANKVEAVSEKYTEALINSDQDGLKSVLTEVSSILDQYPNNTEALFLRFNIYSQLDIQGKACIDLEKLNNLEPIAERVFGECIYCLKNSEKQIIFDCYARASELFEKRLKEPEENINYLLVRLLNNPEDKQALLWLIELLENTKEESMLETYKIAIEEYLDDDIYRHVFQGELKDKY